MPPAPQSYLFIEETEDSTNHVDAYEAALEAVALEAIDKKIAPSGDAWTAKWEKVFATQIEAVRQSNEAEDELRIAEEILAQEDANTTLTEIGRKMIAQRDSAMQTRLRAEKLHHRASILATTTLVEMLACETTRNSSANSLDRSWDNLLAITEKHAAAIRDGKNATYINDLRDTYETSLNEMAAVILTKLESPHSARYPTTNTATTTWTSIFSKQRTAQKMESNATTIIEAAEEELKTLEENDKAREPVIQRRNAAQKSQRRAQKMRHQIQTLAATTLKQALIIYNSSRTPPDPHQARTSPPPITDEIDSPMTQSLSDRKRKAATIERTKEVVADGVHTLSKASTTAESAKTPFGSTIRATSLKYGSPVRSRRHAQRSLSREKKRTRCDIHDDLLSSAPSRALDIREDAIPST